MGVIYLIRHGQASFGHADYDQLSPLGVEQARVLGAALAACDLSLATVQLGQMKRHRETAEACLAAMGQGAAMAAATITPGFDELDHQQVIARFEPRYADRAALAAEVGAAADPRAAFQTIFEAAIARWVAGEHDADYQVPWPAFRARTMAAVDAIAAALPSQRAALVFTSGGPITAAIQHCLEIPDRAAFRINWALVNASATKLVTGRRGLRLSTVNDHSWFEAGRRDLITYR